MRENAENVRLFSCGVGDSTAIMRETYAAVPQFIQEGRYMAVVTHEKVILYGKRAESD
jgi:hypothetical protein